MKRTVLLILVGVAIWYSIWLMLPKISAPVPDLLSKVRLNLAQISALGRREANRGGRLGPDNVRELVAKLSWDSSRNAYKVSLELESGNWVLHACPLKHRTYVRAWYARVLFLDFEMYAWPQFTLSSSELDVRETY